MEHWLTTTIPGIIILGAAGSLVAIIIIQALRLTVFKIVPFPFLYHRGRRTKQAYMLGYSAATIEHDDTGKMLVSQLMFHLSKIVVFSTGFLLCVLLFSIALATQSRIAITWGTFISSASAFTLLYLIYFEFEFIYRTYWFFWKNPLKHAEESYKRTESGETKDDADISDEGPEESDANR